MKTLIYIVGGIVAILAVVFIVGLNAGNAPSGQKITSEPIPSAAVPSVEQAALASLGKIPNLAFQDYSGKTVRLADFAGVPLVVNSWAAWCPFCRKELVDFATAQKEFGDKVAIIAIDRAEAKETAKKYSDELGVSDELIFLLDPLDSFYQSIGGFSMPETIFVDKDGNIKIHKRGPMDVDEIRQKIKEIL